jgi:hypothetical protein
MACVWSGPKLTLKDVGFQYMYVAWDLWHLSIFIARAFFIFFHSSINDGANFIPSNSSNKQ